jgi:hypothetical protein
MIDEKSSLDLILSEAFLYSIKKFIKLKFFYIELIQIFAGCWVEERSLVLYLIHTYINTVILSLFYIIYCTILV